jgi:predicted XRE-type DNA-binding protein
MPASNAFEPTELSLKERQAQEALRVREGLMAQLRQHIANQGWSDEDVMHHFNLDRSRMHYWKKRPSAFFCRWPHGHLCALGFACNPHRRLIHFLLF